jgi:hypothetical protein
MFSSTSEPCPLTKAGHALFCPRTPANSDTSIKTCLHEGQNSNADRRLDIAVRAHGGTGAYTELSPAAANPAHADGGLFNNGRHHNKRQHGRLRNHGGLRDHTASNFSTGLPGDVTGTQNATVVSKVGGQLAATVAQGVSTANGRDHLQYFC